MYKKHQEMLAKFNQLKDYFGIEEGKYQEQGVSVPFHVQEAMKIIRGSK